MIKEGSKPNVMLHPVRFQIILALQSRQLTPRQIGQALADVPQATLYRQLKKLQEAGLVTVVAQRPVQGTLESVYALVREETDLRDSEIGGITREEHQRYFTAFMTGLLGQLTHYLTQETVRGRADGLMYYAEAVYLTPEESETIRGQMRRLIQDTLAQEPASTRRRHTLAAIAIPDPDTRIPEETLP